MGIVIAVVNQKGGVGKSVTCANLAAGLVNKGKKVIILDSDQQGSVSVSLGYRQPDNLQITLATVMEKILEDQTVSASEGILHHEEGIALLPANIELAGIDITLVNAMSRETILRQYVEIIRDLYDYIIIDCPPSLSMITLNSLAAADTLVIPVQAHYLSIKGLEQLFKTIRKIRRQINPNLSISGILLTMVDNRTNYSKEIISLLRETYEGKLNIFKAMIPLSVRAAECSAEGKSIFAHDPSGKVAKAYELLTEEVLELEEQCEKNLVGIV